MRGRRPRHVSVDARTKSVGLSDGAVQSGVDAAVTAKTGEGVTVDASDQELQQYLFDLQGYLVIHNVLGAAEVAELNRLIDAQRLPSPRERIRFGSAAGLHGADHGFLNWGEPFCRLLDHEAILPILRLRLGDCFRLDRLYGIRMHKGQTMGPCTRTTELRRATPSRSQESAFTFPLTASTRGSRSWPGILPMPDRQMGDSGAFPGVTRVTSSCRARSTRPRKRPPAWSFRTYRRGRSYCSPRR